MHLSASHHYQRPEWSDEENRRHFGSDALRQEHNHDYRCEVTVRGSIEPETGIVIDLGLLDEILRREVIDRFQMPNGVEVYCVRVREDRDLRSDAYAGEIPR